MSFDADRLFQLLPAIHRLRDSEAALASALLTVAEQAELAALDLAARQVPPTLDPAGIRRRAALRRQAETGPLKSLLQVIAEQVAGIEESIAQLYDDQFIETCADWVVPYIGALVGYVPIRTGAGDVISRAEVADTIRLRRAKGTASAMAELARDITGRDAAVVEYFQRIATSQNVNHVRPGVTTASLRDPGAFVQPGGPFDRVARGISIRPAALGGRTNIPNLGVFLWPWRALRLFGVTAFPVDGSRFLFSPLGRDMPLVAEGPPARGLTRRDAVGLPPDALTAIFALTVDGAAPGPVRICCLADTGPDPTSSPWANMPASGVTVDPELGRIAFAQPVSAGAAVLASYASAGLGLLGGGPYSRGAGFTQGLLPVVHVPADQPTLAAALPAGAQGTVEVAGNARIEGAAAPTAIAVAANQRLEVRAADGDAPVLTLAAPLTLSGGDGAELTLDGFLVAGAGLAVPALVGGQPNGLRLLRLRHCTLVPGLALTRAGRPATAGAPSLVVSAADVRIELVNCILGPVLLDRESQLRMWGSIVDAGAPDAAAVADPSGSAAAGPVWAYDCTVNGTVHTAMAGLVSNCILLGLLTAAQRQSGLVRFSWLPDASRTPRRYNCVTGPAVPFLPSTRLGDAGYFRPAPYTDAAILAGADDGGEMGAYHAAQVTAQRQGLATRLAEALPFGLNAGFFDVPAPDHPTMQGQVP